MNQKQVPSKGKSKSNANRTEQNPTAETMLGIRQSRVAHTFEDFSVFDCNNGDAFEPLPTDRPRTEQQAAAIHSVFQDSIRLLQYSANITCLQPDQEIHTRTTLYKSSSSSIASSRSAITNERVQPTTSLNDQRITEGLKLVNSAPGGRHLLTDTISSIAAIDEEAARPIHLLQDQRISRGPNHP